jgi:hypothetical protein
VALFSRSRIKVSETGAVTITGRFQRHAAKLEAFIQDLGIRGFSVTLRGGRFRFDGRLDPNDEQRIRNFLVNECPLTENA